MKFRLCMKNVSKGNYTCAVLVDITQTEASE